MMNEVFALVGLVLIVVMFALLLPEKSPPARVWREGVSDELFLGNVFQAL